jgi:hypothetical protein
MGYCKKHWFIADKHKKFIGVKINADDRGELCSPRQEVTNEGNKSLLR